VKTNPKTTRSNAHTSKPATGQASGIDFHGASVINEAGEEIPITETMVQRACKSFIKQWELAHKNR